eukprot:CAMPEP_0115306494 /NCGR_PEP_ID=MMETSP0270-20121206/72615_1 /TAXON_ID=71861 /ORGANISM="Scrippsiella trochoidea, Strain CCMP3099" /LENGTH=69 /DNA_ID=CAMNT_0002724829 /DNA_START=65 /DNA_END=270 /DNA_ORIENTATION=-
MSMKQSAALLLATSLVQAALGALAASEVTARGKAAVGTAARGGLAAAPEDELAREMTHDLEMNFNKIAP